LSGMAKRGEFCGARHRRRHPLPLPLVASGQARRDRGAQVAAGRGRRPVVPPHGWGRHLAVPDHEPGTTAVTLRGRNPRDGKAARQSRTRSSNSTVRSSLRGL